MQKILFIVSDYLPNRNGGTIRIEKLIKYLPKPDFENILLTKKTEGLAAKEIINKIQIYRARAFDFPAVYQKFKKIFRTSKAPATTNKAKPTNAVPTGNERLANYFFVPDVDIFWAIGAFWKTKSIIRKSKINIVYSSAPSYSAHIVALLIKRLSKPKLRWIAEFRDPWTFNPFRAYKPSLLDRFDHYLEKLVVKHSDKLIVTSEVYKEKFLEKYHFLNTEKIDTIPNGYDPEDFAGIEVRKKAAHDKITILHAGNFYGKRSIKPFLVALERFKADHPILADKIEVVQYGALDPVGEAYLANNPNLMVKIHAPIPHVDSLFKICNADWLLLIPGPGTGTTTGKIYEYLASKNPIIALVDEGTAKDIIDELEIGYTIPVEETNLIVNALIEIAEGASRYSSKPPENLKIDKFDRKLIAMRIAAILNTY